MDMAGACQLNKGFLLLAMFVSETVGDSDT
jgi:hypothetical protein